MSTVEQSVETGGSGRLIGGVATRLLEDFADIKAAEYDAREIAREARAIARSGSWRSEGPIGPQADVRGTKFIGEQIRGLFTGVALHELNHSSDPGKTIIGVMVRQGKNRKFVDTEVAKIFPDGRIHPPEIGIGGISQVVSYLGKVSPGLL